MILYPAIDLKGGRCVRLQLGDMAKATLYNDDPVAQAFSFQEQGFKWLHLVDLDGAIAGEGQNRRAVEDILDATTNPVQLGGGIRSLEQIEQWLSKRVARVILGTAALHNPALVVEACRLFPGRIAVGIDARHGKVAVKGWTEQSTVGAIDLARRFEDVGVSAIIYTDIERDGVLKGINWQATRQLACEVHLPIIASGGLASMEDIIMMTKPELQVLNGAITGRALYDGHINAQQALAYLNQKAS